MSLFIEDITLMKTTYVIKIDQYIWLHHNCKLPRMLEQFTHVAFTMQQRARRMSNLYMIFAAATVHHAFLSAYCFLISFLQ